MNEKMTIVTTENIRFDSETQAHWDDFREIANSLSELKPRNGELVNAIDWLRTAYTTIDRHIARDKKRLKGEIYVYVSTQKASDGVNRFWHWLLMSLPQVSVLQVDKDKNIEFLVEPGQTVQKLSMLVYVFDCGDLYKGTLDAYHAENDK